MEAMYDVCECLCSLFWYMMANLKETLGHLIIDNIQLDPS